MKYISIFFIFFLTIFLSGCGARDAGSDQIGEGHVNRVAITEDGAITNYEFNFPNTGWVMEFNYEDSFEITEAEGVLFFDLGDQIVDFKWDNQEDIVSGERYVGHGWWGKKMTGPDDFSMIGFATPDNKYYVTVGGEGEKFGKFVDGMKMKK